MYNGVYVGFIYLFLEWRVGLASSVSQRAVSIVVVRQLGGNGRDMGLASDRTEGRDRGTVLSSSLLAS